MLLDKDEPEPLISVNPQGRGSPLFLIGDHGGRAIPRSLAGLGLDPAELDRHIAWDIGSARLGSALAELLDTPFLSQTYSRLVIDCNRDPARADAICEVSDGTRVPGNQGLAGSQRDDRVAAIFAPYHAAIGRALDDRAGRRTVLVAVHSFTPVFQGHQRPWRFGVLHRGDSAFSRAMLGELRTAEGEAVVGDNEPYRMDEVDYTIPHHADARDLDYLELEVRQDLITAPAQALAMAQRLVPLLNRALDAVA